MYIDHYKLFFSVLFGMEITKDRNLLKSWDLMEERFDVMIEHWAEEFLESNDITAEDFFDHAFQEWKKSLWRENAVKNSISEQNIKYFCNACGEAFYYAEEDCDCVDAAFDPNSNDLIDEHIPKVLRDAYNNAWSEGYGYPCYIMEIKSKPYIALIAEYGDTVLQKSTGDYFRGEDLREELLKTITKLESDDALRREGVEVFLPEDTETPFCQWEVIVAVPAKVASRDAMEHVAQRMYELLDVEEYVTVSNIQWDTDKAPADQLDLPDCVNVPLRELLEEGENEAALDRNEILDRITDWLSDRYGFCVSAYDAE